MSVDGAIDLAAYGDLLNGAGAAGRHCSPGAVPLVVVDLDSPGRGLESRPAVVAPSTSAPFVTVGVSRSGVDAGASAGLDVVLVDSDSAASTPWVAVTDLDAAVADLSRSVSAAPTASVLLAQVLRHGERVSFDDALVLESLAYSTLQGGAEFARWLETRPVPRERPAEERVLAFHRTGDTLHLVLDRPHVHNALNAALRDALCEALTLAAADDTVESVQLSGRGPSFCSGGDLDEFGTAPDPVLAHLVRTSRSVADGMARVASRTVARVHGACVGAGIEIAATAGRVVAAPDVRIRLPELAMGLVPGAGGTASLPKRIGRHRTAWLALTGEWIDAGTARRWGLVDEIEAPNERWDAPPGHQGYSGS